MRDALVVLLLTAFILLHLYANIRLTGDVLGWVPDPRKRNIFLCLVWLLPVAGALHVYRTLAPEWFTPDNAESEGQSTMSAGLMGLDAIFNPSSRNIVEALKKGEITIKAEGQMYDRDLPDFVDVDLDKKQIKNDGGRTE